MLLFCSWSLQAQRTRLGQNLPTAKAGVNYPLTVHIYGLHVRADCELGLCANVLFVDAALNGRKLELRGDNDVVERPYKGVSRLTFGNFRARVLKNDSGANLGDEYELLTPDDHVFHCVLSGIVE